MDFTNAKIEPIGYTDKSTMSEKELKYYDFSVGDTFFVGDVEFRIRCFYCANCLLDISFKEMKKYEKEKREEKH